MPDVFVYIHGVVGRTDGPHRRDYRAIHRGLTKAGLRLPDLDESVLVEWGWPTPEAGASGDLALAQERLGLALAESPAGDRLSGFTVRRLRNLMQYGWSDVVYYASAEGQDAVRGDVWSQLLDRIPLQAAADLTIIGHSIGTLIAHDFLYYLYSGRYETERARICAGPEEWATAESNWRLRRLVTLGSPIGPLLLRMPGALQQVAYETAPWIGAAELGLATPAHSGARPIWLNVWDRHDIVSFPVAGIYGGGDRVRDLYPDFSDRPTRAHTRYWKSRKVHRALAQFWEA